MDSATLPLLKTKQSHGETPDPNSSVKCKRTVFVEPVLYLYALAFHGSGPVIQQYLYARFKRQYPILNGTTVNDITANETNPCVVNYSDPYFIATQAVQEETSQWQMYLQLSCSGIAVFTTLVYGPYSDVAGRKVAMLFPSIAAVLKFLFNAFVIYLELPVWCLLFGEILEGLSGGFETMMMSVFSYIADTIPSDRLGMRITIAESMRAFAMATAQLALGYFIKETGFLYPYITLCGVLFLNLIYVVLFVPESRTEIVHSKYRMTDFSIIRSLKATLRAFTESENMRNTKIGLVLTTVFFASIPLVSRVTMIVLFTMNIPLCWGPELIGIYSAASHAAVELGGLVSLKFFKLCRMPEMWICAVGILSIIAGALTNAWATTDLMMYMVCIASIFIALPIPMCRTVISRLVRVDEQGAVFAGLASVHAVTHIASTVVMNTIYQKTLYFMTGFIFIFGAISASFSLLLILIFISFTTMEKRRRLIV